MQMVAEDLNSIVDEIIEDLDNFMIQTGLDPTELDEIHEGFEFVRTNTFNCKFFIYYLITENPVDYVPRGIRFNRWLVARYFYSASCW